MANQSGEEEPNGDDHNLDAVDELEEDSDLADIGDGSPGPPPPPYTYAVEHPALAAAILDESAAAITRVHDWHSAVPVSALAHGLLADDPLFHALRSLAWYRTKQNNPSEPAKVTLEPLEPDEFKLAWPEPIRSVNDDTKRLWIETAALVAEPFAAARLHDLCFSARTAGAGDHARAAIRAYLAFPASPLQSLYVTTGLIRGWTLARMIRDPALETDAYRSIEQSATAHLSGGGNAGTVVPLIEALLVPAQGQAVGVAAPDVRAMIEMARKQFTMWHLQVLFAGMLRRVAVDDAERVLADRAEVQAHLDAATKAAQSSAKMMHLQTAARVARDLAVKDLEADALSQMQRLSREDLGLIRITAQSTMPTWVTESFLRDFDEALSWQEATYRFLNTPVPTGSYANNLKAAERSLSEFRLHRLFGGVRLGAHNLPQQNISAGDDRIDAEVVSHEQMSMSLYGHWYSHALGRIAETYGVPEKTEIVSFLVDVSGCDVRLASAFATALGLFWAGEFDACVHLAVPRIEETARALLLEVDEPLYRVEKGATIGQFPGLGFMLPLLLQNGFDPDWERFLGTLLLSRGNNLRNLVAHGLAHGVGPGTAALVLRASGKMLLLAPDKPAADDVDAVRHHLSDPLDRAEAFRAQHPVRWWARTARMVLQHVRRPHQQDSA